MVNIGPRANDTVISSNAGHFSPPPGTLAFVPLYQFASDVLIAITVMAWFFVSTHLTLGRTLFKRHRVVLAHVTVPVEPVFVDFASSSVGEQIAARAKRARATARRRRQEQQQVQP